MTKLALCLALSTLAYSQTNRQITFNGRTLTPEQQTRLDKLERQYNARIPDGKYWYDNRSGAAGRWGGPGIAILFLGLDLGGPMPANCSGGGTGVFVNGRELHPADVQALSQLSPTGQVLRGRFWVNANGDFGFEGGPRIYNLYLLALEKQRPAVRMQTAARPGTPWTDSV